MLTNTVLNQELKLYFVAGNNYLRNKYVPLPKDKAMKAYGEVETQL